MLLVILGDSSDYNSNSSGYDQPAESFGTYSQSKSMCSTTSLAPSTQELRDASPWNCKPPPVGTNNNINLYLPWWTNLMTALFPSRFRSWETNLPSDIIFSYLLSLLTFWLSRFSTLKLAINFTCCGRACIHFSPVSREYIGGKYSSLGCCVVDISVLI